MANVVGIRFHLTDSVTYCDAGSLDLIINDKVVVDTTNGPKEGSVVIAPEQIFFSDISEPMPIVLRKAFDLSLNS